MIVGRLDGPSIEIAKGLVDKALQAEKEGLWGRAYFDARGITSGNYQLGDDWIRSSAELCRRQGYETYLDDKPPLLGRSFPLSQVAFYAGWYSGGPEGAFEPAKVEFMPGAFAYHLFSFSAASIRFTNQNWVGPLLAKGATATMGCVYEPYLAMTPNLPVFFSRFLLGFTYGEAALASQEMLSWQTTVVGDPLYRPFGMHPQQRHEELLAKGNKLIEWSYLRVININMAMGATNSDMIQYLQSCPALDKSAVLLEKLGSMWLSTGKTNKAVEAFSRAIKCDPTPQQRVRITMTLADLYEQTTKYQPELELLKQFYKDNPDYPDSTNLHQRIIQLGNKLGKNGE
jgi:tetratricopeptide (TPR) repeat protein